MREIVELNVAAIEPEEDAILRAMGFTTDKRPSERIGNLLEEALREFGELTHPRGLMERVTIEEFATIHRGEGLNEPETPMEGIYPEATHLALFALTLGAELSGRISNLFETGEFALGYILDAVASEGAECAADRLEERFEELITEEGPFDASFGHLRYSPGYCGWHISGQRKLFDRLRPEEIGVVLGETYLMQPLKSVSGVMISGKKEIHRFPNTFSFCEECATQSCRDRLRHLFRPHSGGAKAMTEPGVGGSLGEERT